MANYQNEITKFYQNILGRAPDPGGLEHYTSFAKGGGSLETIRSTILNSPEAIARRHNQMTGSRPASKPASSSSSSSGGLSQLSGLTASFKEAAARQAEQMAKFQETQEARMREFQQQTIAAQARASAPQQTAQVLGGKGSASDLRRAGSGGRFSRPELQIKSVNI